MLLFIVIDTFTEVLCFLVLKRLLVQTNLLLRMDPTWISRISQEIRCHSHTWLLRWCLECLILWRLLMNHPKRSLRRNSIMAVSIDLLVFTFVSAFAAVFGYLGRHSLDLDRYFVREEISIVFILRVLYDVELWILVVVGTFCQGILRRAKYGLEFPAVTKLDVCFVLLSIVELLNMIVWSKLILVSLLVVSSFHVFLGRWSEATAGQPWWVCL